MPWQFPICSSLVATLLFGLLPFEPQAVPLQKTDFSPMEKVLLDELSDTRTPGAAVAVINGGQIAYAKGFGVASVEARTPVNPAMLFRLGAVTRMFTATLLVMLAEEGTIKLHESVGSYVKGLSPKLSRITIHQLLTNTGGLKDDLHPQTLPVNAAASTGIRYWGDDSFVAEPGEKFSFSNPSYWLAGLVIEEVTRTTFADAIGQHLFKPLGMESTTFRPQTATTLSLAQGHETNNKDQIAVIMPAVDHPETWPSGAIFSSVNDLSRFVLALLNGGRIEGRQIFHSSVLTRLSTPYAEMPGTNRRYGYGLVISDYRGVRMLRHGGSKAGFGSLVIIVPERHFAIIILANHTQAVFNRTAEKAMELMLPLQPKNLSTAVLPMSAAEMARCVGSYSNSPSLVEILIRDGQLFLKESDWVMPIFKIGDNRFIASPPLSSQTEDIVLTPGTDGNAEYLQKGSRLFKRIAAERKVPRH